MDPFAPVRFLAGEWSGEGDGQPGAATGSASFRFELDGKVLVRRSHADYPAAKGRPASRHEDLMTLFVEGGKLKAFYVDNEGHVIRYDAAADPEGVVFTSEPAPGPRFRLTYLRKPEARVTVRFEIAPPSSPEAFKTYLEAVTRKGK
jgi:catechol 2,3-dioxygenase-like lactoylglutathione lyase family enzyme